MLRFITVVALSCVACTTSSVPFEASTVAPESTPNNDARRADVSAPEMVLIRAGSFTRQISGGWFEEMVEQEVTLTRDFFIARYEVTQAEYSALMGHNPSEFSKCGGSCPVEMVTWYNAVAYANKLSDQEGLSRCYRGQRQRTQWDKTCTGYRLPTEAEWEYAARAGESHEFAGSMNADDVAWFDGNAGGTTHPVGQKKPNAWGLYDMSGNVWEWVWDWHEAYPSGPSIVDYDGHHEMSYRVERGGSWWAAEGASRVANRGDSTPGVRTTDLGFRLARSLH